jgi:hypothetical protein
MTKRFQTTLLGDDSGKMKEALSELAARRAG